MAQSAAATSAKSPARQIERLQARIEDALSQIERNWKRTAKHYPPQLDPTQVELPETTPTSAKSSAYRIGMAEELAKFLVAETAQAFAALQRLEAVGHSTRHQELWAETGHWFLGLIIADLLQTLRTEQSKRPAEQKRTLRSFHPILLRIHDFAITPELAARIQRAQERYELLVAASDPTEEDVIAEQLVRKAKVKKERTLWEVGILVFFVLVVAIILIMRGAVQPSSIQPPPDKPKTGKPILVE